MKAQKPKLVTYLPAKSKKDKHLRGLFVCPLCGGKFIARVGEINSEKIKGCVCRKKAAFKSMIDLSIGRLKTKDKRLICKRAGSGEPPRLIIKEFGFKHVAVVHELQRRNSKGSFDRKPKKQSVTPQRKVYTAEEINLAILRRADELDLKCPLPN